MRTAAAKTRIRFGTILFATDVRDSSKELLRKLDPPRAEAWCKPKYFVGRSDPAERILDLAKLRNMDLIVFSVQQEKGVPVSATHVPIATAYNVVSRATSCADRPALVMSLSRWIGDSVVPSKLLSSPVRRQHFQFT